jgi:glycosyltransferase involved in cell wall biosynthesis
MRVAVLALGPVGRDTGGRTYLAGILGPLAREEGIEVDVHVSDPSFAVPDGCRAIRHRAGPGPAGRIAAERIVARGIDADVLLGPLNYLPGSPHGPAVVVQHNVLSLPSAAHASRDVSRLRRWYRPRALRRTLARATEVAAVSESLRRRLLADFPSYNPDRVRVVPLGVDAGWAARAADARTEPPTGRVLVVAAHWDYKRLPLALDAFADAAGELPGARLRVAGPGDGRELTRRAERLGVADRVELLGHVPHERLPELYGWADALLHLSTIESFGLPVLEAAAAGVPVVATRIDAVEEVAGDAPLWVEPDAAPGDIAEAVTRAVTDEPARAAAIERGRARASEFTWERSARLLADTLREAAGVAPAAEPVAAGSPR